MTGCRKDASQTLRGLHGRLKSEMSTLHELLSATHWCETGSSGSEGSVMPGIAAWGPHRRAAEWDYDGIAAACVDEWKNAILAEEAYADDSEGPEEQVAAIELKLVKSAVDQVVRDITNHEQHDEQPVDSAAIQLPLHLEVQAVGTHVAGLLSRINDLEGTVLALNSQIHEIARRQKFTEELHRSTERDNFVLRKLLKAMNEVTATASPMRTRIFDADAKDPCDELEELEILGAGGIAPWLAVQGVSLARTVLLVVNRVHGRHHVLSIRLTSPSPKTNCVLQLTGGRPSRQLAAETVPAACFRRKVMGFPMGYSLTTRRNEGHVETVTLNSHPGAQQLQPA